MPEKVVMEMKYERTVTKWEITDLNIPGDLICEPFQKWPDGNQNLVYDNTSEEQARRHLSGWAMRNTNNHNRDILKKSCLGVLLCEDGCVSSNDEKPVTLRPAICDKARKKQMINKCPNCKGNLILQQCRGNSGFPITHFWRKENGKILFQSKGVHDHPRPDIRPHRECRPKAWTPMQNYDYSESSFIKSEIGKQNCCHNCGYFSCQCHYTFDQIRSQIIGSADPSRIFCQPYTQMNDIQQGTMRSNYLMPPMFNNAFYMQDFQLPNSLNANQCSPITKPGDSLTQTQYQIGQIQKNFYLNSYNGFVNENNNPWNANYSVNNLNTMSSQDLSFGKTRPTMHYPLI